MFRRTWRAEWVKLRTLRGSWVVMLTSIGLMVAFTLLICSSVDTAGGSPGCTPGEAGCGDEDVVLMSLGGAYLAQVAFVAFGVMMITAEYATGVIRSTFLSDPIRGRVFWAKAGMLAAVAVAVGAVAAIGSFQLGQAILHGRGFVPANGYPTVSLADPAAIRAIAGTALYFAFVALLSLGIGTIVRRGAGAVAAVLGLLYLPLIVSLFIPDPLRERLQVAFPMMAGLSVQATVPASGNVPMGPLTGLAVAAAWSATALVIAAFVVRRRDA